MVKKKEKYSEKLSSSEQKYLIEVYSSKNFDHKEIFDNSDEMNEFIRKLVIRHEILLLKILNASDVYLLYYSIKGGRVWVRK